MSDLQKLIDALLAPVVTIDGRCTQCGADEWIQVGLPGANGTPGLWDYECECCGHMQPNNPHPKIEQV